jgi:hypothetical protein
MPNFVKNTFSSIIGSIGKGMGFLKDNIWNPSKKLLGKLVPNFIKKRFNKDKPDDTATEERLTASSGEHHETDVESEQTSLSSGRRPHGRIDKMLTGLKRKSKVARKIINVGGGVKKSLLKHTGKGTILGGAGSMIKSALGGKDKSKEEHASEEEAKPTESGKEEAKPVVKNPTWNDKDASGKRDGAWQDRLNKPKKVLTQLKADLAAKYRGENILDNIMGKMSSLVGMLTSGASTAFRGVTALFTKVGGLFRGGKIASMLRGAMGLPGKIMTGAGNLASKVAPAFNALKNVASVGRIAQAASGARMVMMTGSVMAGGLGSTLLGVASAGLAAVGAVLASPFVLGALAVGAISFGAFKLYKYFNRDKIDSYQSIRVKQYGLNNSEADKHHIHEFMELETYLLDGKIGYKDSKAELLHDKIDPEEILSIFSIDKDDQEMVPRFNSWLQERFMPFFLTHLTVLFNLNDKTTTENLTDLSEDDRISYLSRISYDSGPYNKLTSPFKDIDVLSDNKETSIEMIRKTMEQLKTIKTNKSDKPLDQNKGTNTKYDSSAGTKANPSASGSGTKYIPNVKPDGTIGGGVNDKPAVQVDHKGGVYNADGTRDEAASKEDAGIFGSKTSKEVMELRGKDANNFAKTITSNPSVVPNVGTSPFKTSNSANDESWSILGNRDPVTINGETPHNPEAEPEPKGNGPSQSQIPNAPKEKIGTAPSMSSLTVDSSPMIRGDAGMDGIILEHKGVNVDKLNPVYFNQFKAMAKEYFEKTGKKITIYSAFRSREHQDRLYAKSKKDGSVAQGGHSMHEIGMAMDVRQPGLNGAEKLGLMRKYGFTRPVGTEDWHVESAGASLLSNIPRLRHDVNFQNMLVDASVGKGGSGIGTMPGWGKTRSDKTALAIMEAKAGDPPRSDKDIATDKVLNTETAKVYKASNDSVYTPAVSEPAQSKSGYQPTAMMTSGGYGGSIAATAERDAKTSSMGADIAQSEKYSKTDSLPDAEQADKTIGSANPKDTYAKLDTKNVSDLKVMISDVSKKAGLDPDMMLAFAAQESRFDTSAKAGTSGAQGLFQFLPSTWREQLGKHGDKYGLSLDTPRSNSVAQAQMACEYVKSNLKIIRNCTPNPDASHVYMTHLLGGEGARQILTANDNEIAANVRPSAAKSNYNLFYDKKTGRALTVGEFKALIKNTLAKRASEFNIAFEGASGPGQSSDTATNAFVSAGLNGDPSSGTSSESGTAIAGVSAGGTSNGGMSAFEKEVRASQKWDTPDSSAMTTASTTAATFPNTQIPVSPIKPALFSQPAVGGFTSQSSTDTGQGFSMSGLNTSVTNIDKTLVQSLEVQQNILATLNAMLNKSGQGNVTPEAKLQEVKNWAKTISEVPEPAVNLSRKSA